MKKCRVCGGSIAIKNVDVEIAEVVVRGVQAEVCSKCGERYFDTPTATFVQSVADFVRQKKNKLSAGIVKA